VFPRTVDGRRVRPPLLNQAGILSVRRRGCVLFFGLHPVWGVATIPGRATASLKGLIAL